MDARFYHSDDIDIERLSNDLVNAYMAQGYRAQAIGGQDQVMVQLKKGGDFEAIIGMQAALTVNIQRTSGGILAMIGQQRWVDKAAVGAVGIAVLPVLWPLAVTAGVGAIRQASLANQVLNMIDGLVRQQRPNVSGGPIPSHLVGHMQNFVGGPPPSAEAPYYRPPSDMPPPIPSGPPPMMALPGGRRCPHCNTSIGPDDTFCTGCGKPTAVQRTYCANCHTELKPNVAFCPKCGASSFQSQSTNQTASRPAPVVPAAPPRVTYTPAPEPPPTYTPPEPSRPPTPVYTPPPEPSRPPTPVYTPPTPSTPANPPAPQVYYVPSQPPAEPKKPEEPYYVPPTTQEPPVKPQPKVTIVPATPKEEPAPPKPRPQKQYYIPSNQAATDQSAPTIPATPVQPTPAQKPLEARPASSSSYNPNAVWGSLLFSNGQQTQLSGERVIVGRYDHDLGGVKPDLDLGTKDGADTISRVHAAIEHIGSSYTVTDLNSTNATRLNGRRLEPDKATTLQDGDTIHFGKVTCTFKKA